MSTVLTRDLETELELELEDEFEVEFGSSRARRGWDLDTGRAEYNVIGPRDDRVRVTNTTAIPFRHICKLEMTFTDPRTRTPQNFIGTGTLVAQSKVLTAAHCIYDQTFGYATTVRVIPGKNGPGQTRREEPLGFALSSRLDVPAAYRTTADGWAAMPFDYGVITLDRPIGRRIGWWRRIGHVPDAFFQRNRVNTSGYPGSAPAGQPGNGNYQYRVYDRVVRVPTPQRIEFTHDVMGGQSGSAIWVRFQNARKIIGIVTTHDDPRTAPVANTGVRITPTVLNDIRSWLTR